MEKERNSIYHAASMYLVLELDFILTTVKIDFFFNSTQRIRKVKFREVK